MTFCTVAQYEARYGTVADEDLLTEVLEDATREIAAELDRYGIAYESVSDTYAERLMQATRQVAHRAISSANDVSIPVGVTQSSITGGPYSQSMTFSGPYGDIYLTRAERKLLGIWGQARTIRAAVRDESGEIVDGD